MFSTGFRNRCFVAALAVGMCFGSVSVSGAQDKDKDKDKDAPASSKGSTAQGTEADPLKRQIPDKQRKANAKALKVELSKTYRK